MSTLSFFFLQAEDGIRFLTVTGVQTCALPISWLPCVCSSTSMPSARKAAVTASPMAGSSRKNKVLRARTVTLLPSRAKACASSSATTDERSEEHTSELQSQSNLVCRLLLEKKKKQNGTVE